MNEIDTINWNEPVSATVATPAGLEDLAVAAYTAHLADVKRKLNREAAEDAARKTRELRALLRSRLQVDVDIDGPELEVGPVTLRTQAVTWPETGYVLQAYAPCPACGQDLGDTVHSRADLGRIITEFPRPHECGAEAGQVIPTDKMRFLASLGIGDLRRRAKALLPELASTRAKVAGTRQLLRQLVQQEELIEAALTLSDAFKELKNDASRRAWMATQRLNDPDYATAIGGRERAQRELEGSEVALQVLSDELGLIRSEMRLIAAQLLFVAGGED